MSSRRSSRTLNLLQQGSSTLSSRSSSTLADENAAWNYPSASDVPVGKFNGYLIWDRDPTSDTLKILYTCLTVLGLLYMIFSAAVITTLFRVDTSWDHTHGLDFQNKNALLGFPELISATLNLPLSKVWTILYTTLGIYGLLVVADVVLGFTSSSSNNNNKRTHPWPTAWKTDNTLCYHDMFAEPTRFGRLLRRPGNTLSNGTYLLASLCVLWSSLFHRQSVFWMSDILYGIMLFLLAVFSNLWHASNAPWSQYPDLWSMDSCISYLIIRCVCFGVMCQLRKVLLYNQSETIAAVTCLLIYMVVIAALAKYNYGFFQKGWLDGHCPFSARMLLMGKGDWFGAGQRDCHVVWVCAFATLPVFYTALPTLINVMLATSTGSVTAANWAFRCLVIGWTYRMWERFVMDGCVLMNWFLVVPQPKGNHNDCSSKPNVLLTIGAAICSPTAVMHFFTGLTLLTGYMHARSCE
ncbi:expressed unknown protein [Seminavis robusta]|uniref:Uncharacterized protein n=1 Tax=Seminavis robusta TaxID=568900 RepID=A0A9N8EEH7_9STRA|nr:expressed unknown protein [Seminavis robusta]|eukprot:Sro820_g207290.1 n/a (466) ;mRNA; r:35217-36614